MPATSDRASEPALEGRSVSSDDPGGAVLPWQRLSSLRGLPKTDDNLLFVISAASSSITTACSDGGGDEENGGGAANFPWGPRCDDDSETTARADFIVSSSPGEKTSHKGDPIRILSS